MDVRRHLFDDLEQLSRAAAADFLAIGRRAIAARGQFLAVLAGGGTPSRLYAMLAAAEERALWSKTRFFWGDERCVPPGHAGSNYGQAVALLKAPFAAAQVHRVRGELPPEEAAADYAAQLARLAPAGRAWPRFDLVLLGLGDDGHTASLFPGPPHPDESRAAAIAVTATYADRPAARVTLTPSVFNDARAVFFLVSGASKAPAVAATLTGTRNPTRWPAQRIVPGDGSVHWYLDAAAGAL